MPKFRQQFLGAFGFFQVNMNFYNMGVDFLSFIGNVECGHHDEIVLNVIWNVTVEKEFHSVATRECRVHTKEIADRGSKVRFHHVLCDTNLVLLQPGIHLLS